MYGKFGVRQGAARPESGDGLVAASTRQKSSRNAEMSVRNYLFIYFSSTIRNVSERIFESDRLWL
jgi:hypothetical protein